MLYGLDLHAVIAAITATNVTTVVASGIATSAATAATILFVIGAGISIVLDVTRIRAGYALHSSPLRS